MSPFVCKVPTASGATAVQIADKTGGTYRIVEHLGSAHTPEDLAALVEAGKAKLRDPGQATLDFDTADRLRVSSAVVKSSRSGLLIDTIRSVYERPQVQMNLPASTLSKFNLPRSSVTTASVASLRQEVSPGRVELS